MVYVSDSLRRLNSLHRIYNSVARRRPPTTVLASIETGDRRHGSPRAPSKSIRHPSNAASGCRAVGAQYSPLRPILNLHRYCFAIQRKFDRSVTAAVIGLSRRTRLLSVGLHADYSYAYMYFHRASHVQCMLHSAVLYCPVSVCLSPAKVFCLEKTRPKLS